MTVVVGEYVGDFKIYFRLPATDTSIHMSGVPVITVSGRVAYADTSKNEATWCRILGHYNVE